MSSYVPESSTVTAVDEGGDGFKSVHLLVMGLSGVGKSTFISKATGDTSITIGPGIEGVTQDVQEYILYHAGTEVHLIDSPGFDDCGLADYEVLEKISNWINTIYVQKWPIGGIIYLHDITRPRLGSIGQQNIRVLQELTGRDRWNHISLVTTKWHCSPGQESTLQDELQREGELNTKAAAWKDLREDNRPARTCRFLNTKESAIEIIEWHLDQRFQPELPCQMADPEGPQLTLGSTNAGQIIRNSTAPKLLHSDPAKIQRMDEILGRKFDDEAIRFAMQGMLERLRRARSEQRLQRVGRWAIRLSMVGGSILVTFLTENPYALSASFAAGRQVEQSLQRRKTMKREEVAAIEQAITRTCFGQR